MQRGSRPRVGAVGAVVVLGVVAVAGVLVAGPVQIGAPRWEPGAGAPPTPGVVSPRPLATIPPATKPGPVASEVIRIVMVVILAVVVLLLIAIAARYLLRLFRGRRILRVRPAVPDEIASPMDSETPDEVDAPVVQRGIARALAILDEDREPSDAVVQAWLGLEDAATASGAGRRPSETPSEHVARIIRRFDTDRAAADTLRRLYEDVRFGARSVDASAVAVARESLLRLQASWHENAEAGRA